jgi:hypothetical protein
MLLPRIDPILIREALIHSILIGEVNNMRILRKKLLSTRGYAEIKNLNFWWYFKVPQANFLWANFDKNW